MRDLEKKGIIIKPSRGQYDVVLSMQAYIQYKIDLAIKDFAGDDIDYAEARRRNELAKAKLGELQLAELQGELVRADEIAKAAYNKGKMIKDSLLNIPDRIAPIVAAESNLDLVHKSLTLEIRQTIQDIIDGS